MSRKVLFRGKGAPRSPSYKLGGGLPDLTSRSEWSHGMRWNVLEPEVLGQQQVLIFRSLLDCADCIWQTAHACETPCAPVEQDAAMSYKLRV